MIVTKAVGLVEAAETDEPNGAFEVVLSAATLDRDQEVIDSRAFEPLPDHVPFDIDHGMTVQTTVGSGAPYYADDGSLRVKGTFASTPLAQEVRTLVAEGHIRTTSVTFMSADRVQDEKGVTHVKTAELLNGTFTPVPSNRQAVVLSAKAVQAATEEKVGARNSANDASTIQGMHDAAVDLGASCSTGKSVKRPDAKAVAGSLEATRERVQDALEDAYAAETTYVFLRATLPDSCVFEICSGGEPEEVFQQDYTDDGTVVTLTGDRTAVDLNEVITPDADSESADEAAAPAADEAASAAAKSAEDEEERAAKKAAFDNADRFRFGS